MRYPTSGFILLSSEDVVVPPSADVATADTAVLQLFAFDASSFAEPIPPSGAIITGDARVVTVVTGRASILGSE